MQFPIHTQETKHLIQNTVVSKSITAVVLFVTLSFRKEIIFQIELDVVSNQFSDSIWSSSSAPFLAPLPFSLLVSLLSMASSLSSLCLSLWLSLDLDLERDLERDLLRSLRSSSLTLRDLDLDLFRRMKLLSKGTIYEVIAKLTLSGILKEILNVIVGDHLYGIQTWSAISFWIWTSILSYKERRG